MAAQTNRIDVLAKENGQTPLQFFRELMKAHETQYAAARAIGVDPAQLTRWLQKHGIEVIPVPRLARRTEQDQRAA